MSLKRLTVAIAIFILFVSVFMNATSAKAAGVIITQTAATCTAFTLSVDNSDTSSHNVQFIAGGVTSANTTVPANSTGTSIGVTFSYPNGSLINYDIYMDGSLVSSFSYTCGTPVVVTPSVPGPGAPAGFVLRTIVCNVAVYATAGGQPVSSGAAIKAYQSWYINPVAVKVGKQSWTEIFAGGATNGFIPTACVGARPAGYTGA